MHGGDPPHGSNCFMVERLLNQRIDTLKDQVESNEESILEIRRGMDGHVGDLWSTVRKGEEDLGRQLAAHAKDDTDAMHIIETQLLMRVPAWALAVMTIGASIIGAMATFILDRLK